MARRGASYPPSKHDVGMADRLRDTLPEPLQPTPDGDSDTPDGDNDDEPDTADA